MSCQLDEAMASETTEWMNSASEECAFKWHGGFKPFNWKDFFTEDAVLNGRPVQVLTPIDYATSLVLKCHFGIIVLSSPMKGQTT